MNNKVYSASELAALQLPGVPRTERGVTARAEQECWPFIITRGRGGSGGQTKLYTVPEYVQLAIAHRRFEQTGTLSEPGAAVPARVLTERQREVAHARFALLVYVRQLSVEVGLRPAVLDTVACAKAGTLPEALQALVPVSCQSKNLSATTLYRWFKDFDFQRPDAVERLAPKAGGLTRQRQWQRENAPWMAVALKLYQRPSRPTLRDVERLLPDHLPQGVAMPSYGSLRRYFKQMGNVERERGRMGPREIKALKPFVRRDTRDLWPADIYMADGHTFDAEVAHPAHGRPFRPEITSVMDVASRRLLGWSIDLAESGLAVLDALRHAVQTGGISSVFYTDRGSGYRNAMVSGEGTGLLARLGMRLEHSIAYNSQARGMVERLHQMWVAAARELPTYVGADMDPEAANKVHKTTRRDVKQFGASKLLMRWPDFVAFAQHKADQYNDRPHTGLPTFVDKTTGKRRHMTPNEAWAKGVTEGGAILVSLEPGEADLLFRPQRSCKVLRGEVRLFNQLYFSHDLTEFHGDRVRVGYDIHDASQVWVYAEDGRFICKAGFEANKRAFFPVSVLEQAAAQREAARLKRLQARIDEVQEERRGGPLVLENAASLVLPVVLPHGRELEPLALRPVGEFEDAQAMQADTETAPNTRPIFELKSQRYEWLKARGHEVWTEADRAFLRRYVADPDGYGLFTERFEGLGLAWTAADAAYVESFNEATARAAA